MLVSSMGLPKHFYLYLSLPILPTIFPGGPGLAVAVWCSGNALVLINAVALRRARLVLGW